MSTSPPIQRAFLLHEQGRHELAEKELRQVLTADPYNGIAMALLAITLAELDRCEEAETAARQAIGHEPDLSFAHYSLARIMSDRNQPDAAADAIQEAIRIDPEDADYRAMLAAIELGRENWQAALAAAETGLQLAPEHVGCNNFRAMSLVKLGRKTEAGASIDATLAREPENSFSHANKGWTLLEQGQRKDALRHFQESLRLEPGNEWARQGLMEALKAGNPIYALVLKYFLWMQKLSGNARWGILLGGYFGNRLLGSMAAANPKWAPFITPIRVLYIAFALLTWLAGPLCNLFLFVHPLGRHALGTEEKRQASLVGLCVGLSLVFLLAAGFSPQPRGYLVSAMILGMLAIPVSAIHQCHVGWPRAAMTAIAALLALAGGGAVLIISFIHPTPKSELANVAGLLMGLSLFGTFLSMWAANFLITQRPER